MMTVSYQDLKPFTLKKSYKNFMGNIKLTVSLDNSGEGVILL